MKSSPDKTDVVAPLQKAASTADAVYLAGDPDREGEAICAHLADVLSGPKLEFPTREEELEKPKRQRPKKARRARKKAKKPVKKVVAKGKPVIARKNIFRVMFNEITSKAIKAAFEHPGEINENLVDAQQARRVLDRLVGYKISPLLWDKVRRGLSAGRVQTVALRLIVDREVEIRAFDPGGVLDDSRRSGRRRAARLSKQSSPNLRARTLRFTPRPKPTPLWPRPEKREWKVAGVTQKEKRRFAPPPFTTSKLQQAAYNRLRYTAKRTMGLAQRLYEGVELGPEGSVALITYMRTDSVRVSNDALDQVRGLIGSKFGQTYLPEKPNFLQVQERCAGRARSHSPDRRRAHARGCAAVPERRPVQAVPADLAAIRGFADGAGGIRPDHRWTLRRAITRFAPPARCRNLTATWPCTRCPRTMTKKPRRMPAKALLPPVTEGEILRLETLRPEQHFTEPPPRYTEATLVKELEEKGIGRPSTYASIISTIVEREYVTKDQGRFAPTMLGEKVSVLLVKSFEDIFDVGFTARMEEELDEIEEGKLPWKKAVKEFYGRFEQDLEQAKDEMESYKAGIPTGTKVREVRRGRTCWNASAATDFSWAARAIRIAISFAIFLRNCPPRVRTAKSKSKSCDNCGREMIIKRGRWGMFLACTGYPDCKTTRRLKAGTRRALQPDELLDEKCPECDSQLVKKHGQYGEFTGCTAYPKCKFIRSKTLGIKCPKCETGELVERVAKKGRRRVFYGCNKYPDCDFTTPHLPIAEPCPKCGAAFIVEKRGKLGAVRTCIKEGCDWEAAVPEAPAAAVPEPVGSAQT